MELKKSTRKDLESKKNLFFLIGLTFALFSTLVAFEWQSKPRKPVIVDYTPFDAPEEWEPPVTIQDPPPPPPSDAPTVQLITDNITLDVGAIGGFDVVVDVDPTTFDVDGYFTTNAKPVEPEVEVDEDPIIIALTDEKPTFMGGDANNFVNWVNKQIVYPAAAAEVGIEGMVYVNFVITKSGTISNIKVIRAADPLLAEEVVRIVKLSPKWGVGKVKGKPVNVSYNLPIRFKLQ